MGEAVSWWGGGPWTGPKASAQLESERRGGALPEGPREHTPLVKYKVWSIWNTSLASESVWAAITECHNLGGL